MSYLFDLNEISCSLFRTKLKLGTGSANFKLWLTPSLVLKTRTSNFKLVSQFVLSLLNFIIKRHTIIVSDLFRCPRWLYGQFSIYSKNYLAFSKSSFIVICPEVLLLHSLSLSFCHHGNITDVQGWDSPTLKKNYPSKENCDSRAWWISVQHFWNEWNISIICFYAFCQAQRY